jgi:Flp pilus assembly protein TadD
VAHLDLGNALGAQGKLDEALAAFQKVLELKPDDPAARHNLGVLLYRHGRISEAIVQWHELLRLQPDNIPILLRLAWTLATSPEASVRNGREAVALAERAARLTRGRDATILDSLAAAYAEAGRFSDAVQTAEQALALASSQNNAAHADALRARIKLYQLGSPYRDTPQPRLSHPITP